MENDKKVNLGPSIKYLCQNIEYENSKILN